MDGCDYYAERAEDCRRVSAISPELYDVYDVKKASETRTATA